MEVLIVGLCKMFAVGLIVFVFWYLPSRPVERELPWVRDERIRQALKKHGYNRDN